MTRGTEDLERERSTGPVSCHFYLFLRSEVVCFNSYDNLQIFHFSPCWLTSSISASIAHTIACALFHFKISLFCKQLLLTPFGNLKLEQKAGTCFLLYINQHSTKICYSQLAGCHVEPPCFALHCAATSCFASQVQGRGDGRSVSVRDKQLLAHCFVCHLTLCGSTGSMQGNVSLLFSKTCEWACDWKSWRCGVGGWTGVWFCRQCENREICFLQTFLCACPSFFHILPFAAPLTGVHCCHWEHETTCRWFSVLFFSYLRFNCFHVCLFQSEQSEFLLCDSLTFFTETELAKINTGDFVWAFLRCSLQLFVNASQAFVCTSSWFFVKRVPVSLCAEEPACAAAMWLPWGTEQRIKPRLCKSS